MHTRPPSAPLRQSTRSKGTQSSTLEPPRPRTRRIHTDIMRVPLPLLLRDTAGRPPLPVSRLLSTSTEGGAGDDGAAQHGRPPGIHAAGKRRIDAGDGQHHHCRRAGAQAQDQTLHADADANADADVSNRCAESAGCSTALYCCTGSLQRPSQDPVRSSTLQLLSFSTDTATLPGRRAASHPNPPMHQRLFRTQRQS